MLCYSTPLTCDAVPALLLSPVLLYLLYLSHLCCSTSLTCAVLPLSPVLVQVLAQVSDRLLDLHLQNKSLLTILGLHSQGADVTSCFAWTSVGLIQPYKGEKRYLNTR